MKQVKALLLNIRLAWEYLRTRNIFSERVMNLKIVSFWWQEDPTVYQYDEIYDAMEAEKAEKSASAALKKKNQVPQGFRVASGA